MGLKGELFGESIPKAVKKLVNSVATEEQKLSIISEILRAVTSCTHICFECEL